MSKSYRIRTTPGVDKSVNILIDQEFEYLEILSLKLLQSDIYTRQCSDYGVVVGRVSVNNGFGIPNAKVSIFIPLDSTDELNPVISELYPYKTLINTNEDGYRYNLLPYTKSHTGHNPTGTFFDREDVLTNPTLIEVFDKYYKYTATTNESGDYMIFGVPTGSQTIVMDVDLSDIGEFSLSPQDLIRMGVATEAQVSGTEFKSSTNLRELPQIININKTIEVEPLWGQPEICNLGITRTDFDLSSEARIEITPTAIFMGSIISNEDGDIVKRNCKPRNKSGSLCSLVSGPGEILAIRQTIFQDDTGRPVLETFNLEQGGTVIDENGTWLIDVPMNLDYITTNEFGEQVISDDPKKGIPTKGKYRFKVKWSQSPSLSTPVRRGYFLVPNIKEYGWTNEKNDPSKLTIGSTNRTLLDKSYAFSLDWDDYANIQDAIECKDTFYPMQYNKVYTVSQLIDQFRKGYAPNRFIGIKNILDSECESEVNKFPSNDAVFRFDLIYFLFWIMLFLFTPIFFTLIPVIHILWFVLKVISLILVVILAPLLVIFSFICQILRSLLGILSILPFGIGRKFRKLRDKMKCITFANIRKIINDVLSFPDKLKNIKIPNLSYPECSFCDCGEPDNLPKDEKDVEQLQVDTSEITYIEGGGSSLLSQFQISGNYLNKRSFSPNPSNNTPGVYTSDLIYQNLFAGESLGSEDDETLTPSSRVPTKIISNVDDINPTEDVEGLDPPEYHYFTSSLTLSERLNLFNNKSKYFNQDPINNPGGGVNRIKVTFKPELNAGVSHYDNVIAIVCDKNASSLNKGTIVSFQNSNLSTDPNLDNINSVLNVYGSYSITGTTINNGDNSNPAQIDISYANPNGDGSNLIVSYNITQNSDDALFAKFPIDIEYFQVISNLSYDEYVDLINPNFVSNSEWDSRNSFNYRILNNSMSFYRIRDSLVRRDSCNRNIVWNILDREFNPIEYYRGFETQRIIFLVRGVDPNSTRMNIKYDLNRLFGYNFGVNNNLIVEGEFKLNHPIKGGYGNDNHNVSNNLTSTFFYDSFHFVPSQGNDVFNFKPFNTNLHTYYSNTDITNGSFKPDNNTLTPTLNSITSVLNGVRRVKNTWDPEPYDYTDGIRGSNGLIVEWKNKIDVEFTCTPYSFTNTTVDLPSRRGILNNDNSKNRGYYPNEIIDGGSLMYQKININSLAFPTPNELFTYYYASQYDTTLSLNIDVNNTNVNKIVMRSDRLPTSTTPQINLNNSFPLHSNTDFEIVVFGDNGSAQTQSLSPSGSGLVTDVSNQDFQGDENQDEPIVYQSVLDSFNCGNMAPLGCYYEENGEIKIREKNNDCWKFGGGKRKMDGGCYILMTQPIITLLNGDDFQILFEWKDRIQTLYGACRNVFSHLFTNNWINGTLYAFAFKNDVIFTSPFSNRPNQPISRICKSVVVLHNPTNNFYYRSSPWNSETQNFIGNDANDNYGGNFRYLMFPTTILDMGPRNDYIQELVMSDDFDGYVMKNLDSTSYGDVSELLNMLIITRLANRNFLTQIAGVGIIKFFSRTKLMIDGDYAQMNSINSEVGVAPFESINYSWTSPGQDPIFYKSGGENDTIFGIFFSSDTRVRDFISPKRTIINSNLTVTDTCSFNNISVFSQEVPFYQWRIKETPFIFGNQENDWYSDPLTNGYFKFKYQDLDRLNPDSRYFRTNGSPETQFDKGYIYAVKGNTQDDLSAEVEYWDRNTINPQIITVGAPYHFYFGLKKGKSSFDRFRRKWINTEEINIE
jgi:hypothetical protein